MCQCLVYRIVASTASVISKRVMNVNLPIKFFTGMYINRMTAMYMNKAGGVFKTSSIICCLRI